MEINEINLNYIKLIKKLYLACCMHKSGTYIQTDLILGSQNPLTAIYSTIFIKSGTP